MSHEKPVVGKEGLDGRDGQGPQADPQDIGPGTSRPQVVFEWFGWDGLDGTRDRKGADPVETLKAAAFVVLFVALGGLLQACFTLDWMTNRLDEVWGRMDVVEGRMEDLHKSLFGEWEERR